MPEGFFKAHSASGIYQQDQTSWVSTAPSETQDYQEYLLIYLLHLQFHYVIATVYITA
jgi:hypothetical protein